MRYPLAIVVFTLIVSTSHAQFEWLNDYTGPGYTGVSDMTIDPSDHIFAVGNFEKSINMPGVDGTHGGSFFIKLDKHGKIKWTKEFVFADPFIAWINQVESDALGNIYVAGSFTTSISFDGLTFTTPNDYASFIAKFDNDGALQWFKRFDTVQEIFALSANASGQVLLYAFNYTNVKLDDEIILNNATLTSFAATLDSDGDLIWAKLLGPGNIYASWPVSAALDKHGNAYLCGTYYNSLSLDGKTVTGSGSYNYFFTKINTSGICEWITSVERHVWPEYQPANPPSGMIVDFGDLAVDDDGNLYATGSFYIDMKVGSLTLTASTSPSGYSNGYIMKFGNDGAVKWLRELFPNSHFVASDDILLHKNAIYVTGGADDGWTRFFARFDF